MKNKFIHVSIIEGFSTAIERALNMDHVIQFGPNIAKSCTCHVWLTDGKVICVVGTFEQLIQKFNN
jgi:hypothetical protein